jgi:hypothetical protein
MTTCQICLQQLDETKVLLECNHRYCEYCIKEWFVVSNKCPQCKKEFFDWIRLSDLEPEKKEKVIFLDLT